jgi:hypothetical protein
MNEHKAHSGLAELNLFIALVVIPTIALALLMILEVTS